MIKYSLPERNIFSGGIRYIIHGLVHGNPWVRIKPSFKRIVNSKLKDKNILCEDGFISWIPSAISMDESEYFGFGRISFFERTKLLGHLIYDYLFFRSEKSNSEIFKKIEKMNSLEELIEIRNSLFQNYPKEPEGMNALMRDSSSGTLDNPRGNIPLIVRRYIYEAKTSINYAQERNLPELHIVVGCAHELPLEYLLNNEDILKKYSL